MHVTFTDAPKKFSDEGKCKVTSVVCALPFHNVLQPSPDPTRLTFTFTLPPTRVGCDAVIVKLLAFSLYKYAPALFYSISISNIELLHEIVDLLIDMKTLVLHHIVLLK